MARQGTIAGQIIEAVRCAPECTLEELVLRCPDLNWAQVFSEVDRLSRSGQLRLTKRGAGVYTLRLQTM